MIYLVSPYSHPDPAVREQRFRAACQAAAALMRAAHLVFSPVAHSHPIAMCGLPTDWGFWQRQDLRLLAQCDAVVVLQLDGWVESRGVRAELEVARALGKPIWFLAPEALATGSPTLAHVGPGVPS
jgi:nucleoside 2-deoxyribosyltransferase